MKILQVLPYLEKGGAERVVIELSNDLIKKGHEVILLMISPVDVKLNQKNLDAAVEVVFMLRPKRSRFSWTVRIVPWILIHRKFLKSFDVIHCHLTFGLIFGSLMYSFRALQLCSMPKLIMTCHMVGMYGWTRSLNKSLSSLFDSFVLVGWNQDWREISDKKFRRNIHVIENGITTTAFKHPNVNLKRHSVYTVGTISRLVPERRPWLFLQTFSEIRKLGGEEIKFILGGDGSQRKYLTELSKKLEIERDVRMPGLITEPSKVLRELDLYLTMSVEKFPGIAALEAILHGIPVVGVQVMPDYLTDGDDFIWSNQDPALVAQKIIGLISNKSLREEYRLKQYAFVIENYHVSIMSERYLKLYQGSWS